MALPDSLYTHALILGPEVQKWLHELRRTDRASLDQVAVAIEALRRLGPDAPFASRVPNSAIPELKELRPNASGGSKIHLLFFLDAKRRIVVLAAGRDQGQAGLDAMIPLAEELFRRYLQ